MYITLPVFVLQRSQRGNTEDVAILVHVRADQVALIVDCPHPDCPGNTSQLVLCSGRRIAVAVSAQALLQRLHLAVDEWADKIELHPDDC